MHKSEVYCVKCREAVHPRSLAKNKDVRGRMRVRGRCPHCDTVCFKYVAQTKKRSPRR